MSERNLTVGGLAKLTGISTQALRNYCDAGLVPAEVLANGWRVFPAYAAEIAKRVHAERLARVGRKAA